MKNRKRLPALLLSLALAVSLCACGAGEPEGSPSAGASQDPDASPSIEVDLTKDAVAFSAGLSGENILLTVNGEDISADLFLYFLYDSCDWLIYQYYYTYWSLPDLEPFAKLLLDDAVDVAAYHTVLRQKAAELGCLPTDAQVQEAKDKLLADGQEYYDLQKAAYGLSDRSMDYLSTFSCYYENLLDAMIPAATGEMLNGYVYQVKHILLKTVDSQNQPLSDEEIAAQRALAEDILAQLQAAEGEELPVLFDELMNEYSEDGRDENGDLYSPDGYTAVPGDMVTEFEEASLALPIGGLSGIVESSYGYHIILRGEVADPESYADDCRVYLMDKELRALTKTAEITRTAELDALDVPDFYERYTAYQNAVKERYEASGSGDPDGGAVG